MRTLYAEHFSLKEEHLAEVLGFYQFVFKETTDWMGGFPAGNEQTIYSGFGYKDNDLNKNIHRYSADPEALELAVEYHTTTGEISYPVLALHNTYDEIVPVHNYKHYEELTTIKNTSHLYRQQYIMRDGHCYFENEEVEKAFDQLLKWIKEGKYPE